MNSRLAPRAAAGIAALAVTGAALAACSPATSEGSADAAGMIPVVQLGDFGGGSNPQVNYNPFSANRLGVIWGIYDTLMTTNGYDCSETPELATEYEWVTPSELHLTLRENVTWNDGEPFTAEDVAYTFGIINDNAALDLTGLGAHLESAEAVGENEAVLTFDAPSVADTPKILATSIVPEHVWSQQEDPVTYTAEEAVGTGMFTVKSFTPQRVSMQKNPDYWDADKVKVQEVRFVKDGEAQINQLNLAKGMYDAQYMYVPDIEDTYVKADPDHHGYWFAPGSPISLLMNNAKAPFDDLAFRAAIMHGIDKETLVKRAGEGYTTVASQTSLVVPGMDSWLDPSIADKGVIPFDAQKADELLTAAGYATDSDGRRLGKDGEPLAFTFITPQGWDDWTRAANEVVRSFEDLGIEVTLNTPEFQTFEVDRRQGNYDLLFGVRGGTCSMFQNFNEPLHSDNTAPIGKDATTNESRFSDPAVDALLDQLRNAKTPEEQKPIVVELQKAMIEKVPFVPLWYGARWFEYNTARVDGWPTEDDPYAAASDNTIIFKRLAPADGE
ncbi:ABC transporter substrate-binding protein [Microbacterium sp. BK668]|uniref:ABC transporter substrate-binding protein n=1 Tax=Microbacterium sp. BK668 TaxID=2512118 RepID=UPI0010604498|nr:ABC transporter substrate-binding protein [Microbacterium sp. BK668]TDN91457.1 peptide/nickel transport system substrate-binding protein [Microbacterium sp. BK668]